MGPGWAVLLWRGPFLLPQNRDPFPGSSSALRGTPRPSQLMPASLPGVHCPRAVLIRKLTHISTRKLLSFHSCSSNPTNPEHRVFSQPWPDLCQVSVTGQHPWGVPNWCQGLGVPPMPAKALATSLGRNQHGCGRCCHQCPPEPLSSPRGPQMSQKDSSSS